MFKLDAAAAAAIIAEEDALATLRNHSIESVLASIEDIGEIEDEEAAFNALMEAMYALRPQGYL
ncbi:MAG: hypothetical protein Q8P41_07155 [Pseudomonadota bacterium]|nr:hypothetical protein [Pseudomonadota bacterium]